MGLGNLCVVVDLNFMQVEGHTDKVLKLESVADKWASFGWRVADVDGHDIPALQTALAGARAAVDRPTVVIARTLVGKGVGFLEGQLGHNMKLSPQDTAAALRALDAPTEALA